MARSYFFLFALLAGAGLQAQSDTTLALKTVIVTASRFRQTPPGHQVITLDSNRLQTVPALSIADLLQQNTGIFIKSYGLGSLATSAMRGGSAQHTAVVWNGFPIQNPMLGQLDLALLPAGLLDAVQVQYGGNGALWGSGAIGGVIQLNNHLPFDQGWNLRWNSQIGSFSQIHNDLKISFSNHHFASTTRLLYQTAENNFPYRITPDAPQRRQQNAGFQQIGLLQENRFLIKPNQSLNLRLWLSQAEQKIPPTTTQNFSVARQNNEFLRATLDWQLAQKQWIVQARTGLFYDFFHYRDSIAGVDSPSHSWTSISEAEAQWNVQPRQQLHLGIHHTSASGEADGYPQGQQQQQSAIFAAYQWQSPSGKWRARASARQGLANGDFLPPMPTLGLEWNFTKWLIIKGNITRNFRLPTLNDWYWQPGGNANLQPENGWSEELALQTHWQKHHNALKYALTGFNRNINNWILWVPGASFWSPQNIAAVHSRGLEQRVNGQLAFGNWQLQLDAGYDWILSTQKRAATEANLHKQLIYTPKHQAFGRLAVHWQQLQFAYQHQYTGRVFTRSDNQALLPEYQLGFLNLRYGFDYQKFKSNIFLQINNLWNANYRVIERRRMPGRNYQLGITLQLKS